MRGPARGGFSLGFGWGVALGIFLGLLIGLSRAMERVLDPTIQVMRNIPVTAWVPLSLVFFGIGNAPAVFLIGLGAFFPAAINTTHGVRQINITLYKAARMMGANERELLSRVILPAALPSILTGVRLSMGIAWVLVVVAEILAVQKRAWLPAERCVSVLPQRRRDRGDAQHRTAGIPERPARRSRP